MAEAVLEIVDHFGAASYETQRVEGHWRHSGILYRDDLVQPAEITQRVLLVAVRRISRAVLLSCTSIESVSDAA